MELQLLFLDVNLLLGSDWTASRMKRGNTILVVRLQTVFVPLLI